MRRKRYAEPKDPNDPRHGTNAFYENHGCKCDKCRAVNAATTKARRHRLAKLIDPEDERHGTTSFYQNHGCRCDACKDAQAAANYKRSRTRVR